ncbi:unnamed protein product [Linum trigynum]|uniref:RNase H type-1 domain-containing protein n=1 Tax=Linum trigynum TaxID=586398 RepID=A0AAV2DKL8_9ROSI
MRQFQQQYEEWVRLSVDRVPTASPPGVGLYGAHHLGPVGADKIICMWDGAVRRGSHSAGGVVLFTPNRAVWLVKGIHFPCLDDPLVVELLVLREAVLWCLELGLSDVRFEGDAKIIIDKIIQADVRDNRVGAVLEELLPYFSSLTGFSVRFVGRRSNRVAHMVARKALSLYPTMSRFFNFQACLISRM